MRDAELKPAGQPAAGGFAPALPEFDPAPDLWPRILVVHRRRRIRRRLAIASGFAALGLALVVLFGAAVRPPEADPLMILQDESTRLQASLRASPAPLAADWWQQTLSDASKVELRLVDAELQAAYDRRAGPAELEPLWQRRAALLRSMVAAAQSAPLVTRI